MSCIPNKSTSYVSDIILELSSGDLSTFHQAAKSTSVPKESVPIHSQEFFVVRGDVRST